MGILDQITHQYKFLGATVMEASLNGGNGNQATSLSVTVVEDPERGDSFDPPRIWSPVTFEVEQLKYRGLLQYQSTQKSLSGYPTYQVNVTDPREIIDGVQVILGGFNLPTNGVPNLLNVYGYWENKLGYGGALTNESGMLWQANQGVLGLQPDGNITISDGDAIGIKPAIEFMTHNATPYGGPLNFRGYLYSIDMSGLPLPPTFYRLGGGVCRTLMDLIDELCLNAGADYQVVLGDDNVIRFKVVYKNTAPTIGVLANWAGSQSNIQSMTVGTEMANEYTNAVLFGGWVQRLNIITNNGGDAIWPYWGLDSSGNAIWGQGSPEDKHTFTLDCSPIAEIVGDVIYPCSIAELRAAFVDMDSWTAYVLCQEPDKATALDLMGSVDGQSGLSDLFGDVILRRDLLAIDLATVQNFGRMNDTEYWTNRIQVLYDFVSQYAREYLGQKFLVRIPFWIYWKAVPETTHYLSSEEISDGGYLTEGTQPLGLPYTEIDKFLTDDGRFACFVAFPIEDRMDLSSCDPSNVTIANGTVYVKAWAEQGIYYPNGPFPYAVVTLSEPIHEMIPDPLGGVEEIANMLNLTKGQVAMMAGSRHGSFPVRIGPASYRPSGVALPTKSNTMSYGPWSTGENMAGKTFFDQDEDLTPWTYGDIDTMNQAAIAKIASTATALQEVETATIKVIDTPALQLGDALVAGGPSVTSIAINLSTSEISTTYTMRTYTPTFGAFSRYNAERLKRLGIAAQQMRQKFRTLYQQNRTRQAVAQRAFAGMMLNSSHAIAQRSPHECLMASMIKSETGDVYRTQASTMACDEFMANIRADDDEVFRLTAGMGMEGLLRPFSTLTTKPDQVDGDGKPLPTSAMSHFEDPVDEVTSTKKLLTTKDMNPFKDSDIDLMVSGQTYENLHRLKGDVDPDDMRGLALRGPLVVQGYGLELTGKPIPNKSDDETLDVQTWEDDFLEDYKLHPEKWKTGILALAWNKWTKTFMQPVSLFGKALSDIDDQSEGQMLIDIGDGQYGTDQVAVLNRLGATIAVDSYLICTYKHEIGRYIIASAVCSS